MARASVKTQGRTAPAGLRIGMQRRGPSKKITTGREISVVRQGWLRRCLETPISAQLRQHLAALAEQRVGLGALVFQEPGLGRLDHLVELVGIAEPGHRHVVGPCVSGELRRC